MSNEQLIKDIVTANQSVNELVKLAVMSDSPEPLAGIEHTKEALRRLKAVYHAFEKQLNTVTV